jgi:hypothetical protein
MAKNLQELYEDFLTELQNLKPELTDTNEGSIIDVLAGATAAAVDEVSKVTIDEFKKTYFDTAEGDDLERLAVDHFNSDFARPAATKSTGTVTFSRPTATAGNVTIPEGTIVKTEANAAGSSQRFEVTSEVVMTGLTVNASVRAITAGPAGNVQADTVIDIESTLTDSTVVVTNDDEFTGGDDEENDSEYRETIRNKIQTLSGATADAITAKALTVAGVEIAKTVEYIQEVIEWDPAGEEVVGESFQLPRAKLYIADSNGTASSTLIQDVKDAIMETRACGVFVDVIAAIPVEVDWTAAITLDPDGPNYAELSVDTALITNEMQRYVQDLDIGDDFDRAAAKLYIMAKFGPSGTGDITDFVTSEPTGNVSISSTQKAIPGTMEVA